MLDRQAKRTLPWLASVCLVRTHILSLFSQNLLLTLLYVVSIRKSTNDIFLQVLLPTF